MKTTSLIRLPLVLFGCAVVAYVLLHAQPAAIPAEDPKGPQLPVTSAAHGVDGLYRVTTGVFDSHVEYHRLDVQKGREVILADLKGPGKVTYWYITDSDLTGAVSIPDWCSKSSGTATPSRSSTCR